MSLARLVEAGLAKTGVRLAPHTTYRFGGHAAYFVEAATIRDLAALSEALREDQKDVLVLGRGSNLVVSEKGFDGVVIRLGSEFANIDVEGNIVRIGAIAPLPQVARRATSEGVRGLEFLIGVPGSTGGGVRQNAGCFGSEMSNVLVSARIFDLASGHESEVEAAKLELGYRHSCVASTEVVIAATMRGVEGKPEEGLELIREHTRWRRLNQPGGTLNAGSVFKNPLGDSAGRIIDSLGLKGLRVGGASVSVKHANFFVAMPGTEANDVYLLVRKVARLVKEETGIVLEPEIQFIGEFKDE